MYTFIDTLHILRLQNGYMYIINTRTLHVDPDSNSFAQKKKHWSKIKRDTGFSRGKMVNAASPVLKFVASLCLTLIVSIYMYM